MYMYVYLLLNREHRHFVQLCLKMLSTHLSLALVGGMTSSVLGNQAPQLRNMLFRLLDSNIPDCIRDVSTSVVLSMHVFQIQLQYFWNYTGTFIGNSGTIHVYYRLCQKSWVLGPLYSCLHSENGWSCYILCFLRVRAGGTVCPGGRYVLLRSIGNSYPAVCVTHLIY